MRRLLLIGPNFHYFVQSIEHSFRALGWEVFAEKYDEPIHPYNSWNKVRYKFATDKRALREASKKNYADYLRKKYLVGEKLLDLIFILNGSNLNDEIIRDFSAKTKVVFWLFDSISRFPELKENLRYAFHIFCYEKTDIPLLAKQGIQADFLPQSVDTNLYFPIPDCEKKYDIVFAGDIYVSKKRQLLLNAVIREFPDKRMLFVGQIRPWFKNPWKWLTRPNRNIFTNRSLPSRELNELYNSARVVLNIHNEQQVDGANPKVYEIAASGAFQICDYTKYIAETFPELCLYKDETELIKKIREALRKDCQHSSQISITQHSTDARMKEMLEKLKFL